MEGKDDFTDQRLLSQLHSEYAALQRYLAPPRRNVSVRTWFLPLLASGQLSTTAGSRAGCTSTVPGRKGWNQKEILRWVIGNYSQISSLPGKQFG